MAQRPKSVSEDRVMHMGRLVEYWKIGRSNSSFMVGLGLLLPFVVMAISAPILVSGVQLTTQAGQILLPPSWDHLLGTDEVGRDMVALLFYGSQVTLFVGILAGVVTAASGTGVGMVSGYYGGLKGELLMRLTDIFLVIPALPLAIVLAAVLGSSLWNVILVIAISTWPSTARLTRSQVLSLKERPFVVRARAVGCGDQTILARHLFPNVVPIVFANSILVVAQAIMMEAMLSFLGLGDPTHISWGMIIHYALTSGSLTAGLWWYVVPAGVCILLVILGLTLMGTALEQAVNPRMRKR
jgi:peptide/nickel transport system permease protein